MSSKFSSAFVVTLLLSHTVLAPLTAVAQETTVPAPVAAAPASIDAWMPDTALQNVVAAKLGKPVSAITQADMSGLTTLVVNGAGITNLKGLEYAPNLVTLNLAGNNITDIGSLQHLSNLTHLELDDNYISDISSLSGLTKLSYLDVSRNQIIDISSLGGLSNLSVLYMVRNNITDISPLKHLSKLQDLQLFTNQIADISPLKDLSNLTHLKLGDNQISDIRPLQNLSHLTFLEMDHNHISDLTPLQNLTITNLDASDQTITLPSKYVLNKQPYSLSVPKAIKTLTSGMLTISPQNSGPWTGTPGKAEWSSTSPVPQTGSLVFTWNDQNVKFSGTATQPYALSQASITVKDSTVTEGGSWHPSDSFLAATDEDGKPLDLSKITVTGTVDTTHPGVYPVKYSYGGVEKTVNVTVKAKPSITVKDSTVTEGGSWQPSDSFVSAKDSDGNPLDFSKITVSGIVNTGRPGVYPVKYSYGGVEKTVNVTVKAKPSTSGSSTSGASKGEVQGKKGKASKELPATGEKDTNIFSAIGLGILAILAIFGTYISRKKAK